MARIPYPGDSPQTRSTLERMPPLNLFRMVANAPSALRPFLRYGGALLSDLELDPVLREPAILRVAARTGCDYERIQHEPIAVGVSAEQVAAALDLKATPTGLEGAITILAQSVELDPDRPAGVAVLEQAERGRAR